MEPRSFFNESLINGWIDFNPALQIKAPIAKVTRQRMTLEDWSVMFEYSKNNGTGWAWRLLLLALLTGQRRSDLSNMKFSDVYDEHLHVTQNKTGAKVAIPLSLRLDEVGLSIGEAIELCRGYTEYDGQHDDYMIRKTTGGKPSLASLSARFEYIREQVFGKHLESNSSPFTLHEIRSLSARLYYGHGEIEVQTLLGHSSFKMTAMYINDRGKSRQLGKFKVVKALRKD
jgi:integrase